MLPTVSRWPVISRSRAPHWYSRSQAASRDGLTVERGAQHAAVIVRAGEQECAAPADARPVLAASGSRALAPPGPLHAATLNMDSAHHARLSMATTKHSGRQPSGRASHTRLSRVCRRRTGPHAPESDPHAGQAAATSVSHNVCQLCLADPCGPTLQASLVKRAADRDSVPPSEVSAERRLSSAWQACGPRSHPMADARAAKRQTRLRLVPMHSRDAEKHPVDTKKNRLCRRFLNGSDGTRARDLRRDRDTAPPCWPERRWTRFRGHTSVCYPMLLPNWWLCLGWAGAKRSKLPLLLGFESGASRNRTGDLLGAIQALSHLSYSPVRQAPA